MLCTNAIRQIALTTILRSPIGGGVTTVVVVIGLLEVITTTYSAISAEVAKARGVRCTEIAQQDPHAGNSRVPKVKRSQRDAISDTSGYRSITSTVRIDSQVNFNL